MSKNNDKITKFKFFLDLDKEVEYINKMNKEGWKLVYIKGGCFYTFVKTAPDEYITVIHAESKEKISEVTTFAAQCGYENIPHTMDGFGDIMYLTGKKNEVSDEFASDYEEQVNVIERIRKKFIVISVIHAVLDVLLLLEAVAINAFVFFPEFDASIIPFALGFDIFCLIYLILSFILLSIQRKYKKKIKALKSDSMIYES